jgi:hypothetical protein
MCAEFCVFCGKATIIIVNSNLLEVALLYALCDGKDVRGLRVLCGKETNTIVNSNLLEVALLYALCDGKDVRGLRVLCGKATITIVNSKPPGSTTTAH